MEKIEYTKKEVRSALNVLKNIDSWFWCRYTINPYIGCEHACIYCDGRSNKYYLHKDFENKIFAKVNLPALVEKKIKKHKEKHRDIIAIGGVCDAYQPIEKEYKITKRLLEIFINYKYPVIISTKSILIGRDIDLFGKIAEQTWASISFTITTMNEKLARILEPKAPSPIERMKVLLNIKKEYPKIQTGINIIPIIPYITDYFDNIEEIIKSAKNAKVDYILHGGLTLRDSQKLFFINKIKENYYNGIKIAEKINKLYYKKIDPHHSIEFHKISRMIIQRCNYFKINNRIKRWIPKDYRKNNYFIAEKLLDKAYYNMIDNKAFWDLQKAGSEIQNLPFDVLLYFKNKNSNKNKIKLAQKKSGLENNKIFYKKEIISLINQIIETNRLKLSNSLDRLIQK